MALPAVNCSVCGGSQDPAVLNAAASQGHRFVACRYCSTTLELTVENRDGGVVVVDTGITLDAILAMDRTALRKSMVNTMSLEAFKLFANDCMPKISPRETLGPLPYESLASGSKEILLMELISWAEQRGGQAFEDLKMFYYEFLVTHSMQQA